MKLASIFTDNMVLQQGTRVPVWGTARPGDGVTVGFGGQEVAGEAGADGRWRVWLKPLRASRKPGKLDVRCASGRVTLTNVLVGEVWVCSGQSNMGWPLRQTNDSEAEIAAATYPEIRLLMVPQRATDTPQAEQPALAWSECSPQTVSPFSAVGYFFGRELHRRLSVPVGLINSSWGGTVAEAWVSRGGLMSEPSLNRLVEDYESCPSSEAQQERWKTEMAAIGEATRDTENIGFGKGWGELVEPPGDWKDMEIPGLWQYRGVNYSGIFWFRKEVIVPSDWAGKDLSLAIGATDKSDITYFNNEQVGSVTMRQRPDAWSFLRTYTVPGRLVKAGPNLIAIRIHSNHHAGGMTGPTAYMRLACPSIPNSNAIPLAGIWRYAVEKSYGLVRLPPQPLKPGNQNVPAALYNGMIACLVPLAVRGAIWYQGESNVGRAKEYQVLFPKLISDWRRVWGQEEFDFYFVQLANFMARCTRPTESQWAELREAQTMTLAAPRTGMAVSIDIGDSVDIHPANKQDVGLRLAVNALHATYGQRKVVPAGPLFKAMKREGDAIRLTFEHAGGGLVCRGAALRGFAVAGKKGDFAWATARIEGQTIVVSSPEVPKPVHVRYAWADNPDCNLYNYAGLPASPFRTDGPTRAV